MAVYSDEFFEDDAEASGGQNLQGEDVDCEEELENLENVVSVFLTSLTNLVMELNRNGQLKGEGYKRIMNLIDDYWKDDEAPEEPKPTKAR